MSAAPALRETLPVADAASFAAATGASASGADLVERLRGMLVAWNAHINLVSAESLADFWVRHAFDSAQLVDIAPTARIWIDIGAGAGFPGLVLAILLKGRAGAKVHLVESRAKRCRFLTAAAAALDLPAEIHCARAETLAIRAEIVTARAVAPLSKLVGLARPAMDLGAVGLFLKGAGVEAEIAEARKSWRFGLTRIASRSDPGGTILKLEGLERAR